MALTNTLLLALCANWPPLNITETTLLPPWKWSECTFHIHNYGVFPLKQYVLYLCYTLNIGFLH